ncbi:hypothetical protein L208DRAFT_1377201 [Tricholoma matsutake]|nr:hypothetical protein L208DRAFT_1377201 [Tricholoma matsutake 945]
MVWEKAGEQPGMLGDEVLLRVTATVTWGAQFAIKLLSVPEVVGHPVQGVSKAVALIVQAIDEWSTGSQGRIEPTTDAKFRDHYDEKVDDDAYLFLEKLQQDGTTVWMDFSQRLRCIPGPEANPVPWEVIADFSIKMSSADYVTVLPATLAQLGKSQNDPLKRCLKLEKVDISALADDKFGIIEVQKVLKQLGLGECFELKKAARQWLDVCRTSC